MPENNKPLAGVDANEDEFRGSQVALLYVTFPSADAALLVGRELVEKGLAGCINVLPAMTSVYVWQGATEMANEAAMIAKLGKEGLPRAIDYIKTRHPYELPAIIALPVVGGSAEYIDWVLAGTKRG